MEKQGVKLLGKSSSPYVRRVEWALKLKGIEYEYQEEDLLNKSALLLESNPVYKKVPVLIHGGKPICNSLNIVQYIDEVWPQNRLLPEDPCEKARVLFWGTIIDDKLGDGLLKVLRAVGGEEQESAVKQFDEALGIIEGEIKGIKKFFGGESIKYLDLVLGWTVLWIEVVEEASCGKKVFDLSKFPYLSKWMEEFKEVGLIKENLPSKDEVLVYMQNNRKIIVALAASKAKN